MSPGELILLLLGSYLAALCLLAVPAGLYAAATGSRIRTKTDTARKKGVPPSRNHSVGSDERGVER